jgi:hypothetical protein
MIHGVLIRNCGLTSSSLASTRQALWCLQATNSWLWLARSSRHKTFTANRVVLLHGLSGLLVALGEGARGHG